MSVANSVGPIVSSPAVGRDATREWVFYETTTGTLGAWGGSSNTYAAASNQGSLAIASDSTANMRAVAAVGTEVMTYDPAGGRDVHWTATQVAFPGNIVTDDTVFWVANVQGKVDRYVRSTPAVTTTFAVAAGTINGLSLFKSDGGLRVAGGGGTTASGRLFVIDDADGGVTGYNASNHVGGVSVGAGGASLFALAQSVNSGADFGRLCRFDAVGSMSASAVSSETLDFPAIATPGGTTPVLGQNGAVFAVSNSGEVLAARQSSLATEWLVPLTGQGAGIAVGTGVKASPSLDCNWQRPGTGTGILYFAAASGWLVAYIVDSPGLDRTAAWPKYQHDVRNTGNSTVPIDPCP